VTRVLGWSAVLGIGAAILIMIAVSFAGPSQAVPAMPPPAAGPPWWHAARLSPALVTIALWMAAIVGCAGTMAGLAAVTRGARPPTRMLLASAFIAITALTAAPPAGTTDVLSYAIDGRIVAVGHSPYVMTPAQLRHTGDPIGRLAPWTWATALSIYGPLGTGEEWAAAKLGGTSAARIAFWLKLWNALAFGAVILALDRLLRSDPARRARAHLLWSVNPLLLWAMIAGGHVDGLATALGFFGLIVMRMRPGTRPAPWRALAAGLLIGAATAIKVPFSIFGVGITWAARRSAPALAAAATGFLALLLPAYLLAGRPAIRTIATRSPGATWDNLYQLFYRPFGYTVTATTTQPALAAAAGLIAIGIAVLLLRRLPGPDGFSGLPAVPPAMALSLAWLFAWPFQRPWYDVMVVCLLALYPASRLDWIVLVRLLAGTTVYMPGVPGTLVPHWLNDMFQYNGSYLTPAIRLAAIVAIVWLCLSGAWHWRSSPAADPRMHVLV